MGVEKRLEKKRLVRRVVTSKYYLELGEQKCLKIKYAIIRCGRRDRAKKKNRRFKKQKKQKKKDIKTVRKDTV